MATLTVQRKIACASEPQRLWCVITDTERLNRAIGLGPIRLEPNDDDSAARFIVDTVTAGFPVEYEERPYEWVENQVFTVRRNMRKGAARWLENSITLTERSDGTDVEVKLCIEPRIGILGPVIKMQMRRMVERIGDELSRIDKELMAGRSADFRMVGARLRLEELDRAVTALRARCDGSQTDAVDRLVDAVSTAADVSLDRMRPLELAEQWGLDGRTVLATCLNAVVTGLLELRWDIICPSCMTASDRLASLGDLGDAGHCQLCDIGFDLALDQSVEATFRPAPGIRELDEGPYCIGGPARTPHVVSQAIIERDGHVAMTAPQQPGAYRLFVRGGATAQIDVASDGAAELSLTTEGDAPLGEHRLAPGASIRIEQRGGSERHVKLERAGWTSRAATASLVATIPDFRRQFASEALRPGVSLRVGHVSLMFTDLTASTQLYTTVGDALAFRVVQDHFDLLEKLVDDHSGAVVKTMGDAIMAVFLSEDDALAAAATIHDRMASFRETHAEARQCFLKVGVYSGPCYAVRANGILDYFGQTVNVAARLQAEARAGELVLTAEALARSRDNGHFVDCEEMRFEAHLKGVGEVRAARVWLDRPE
jgi:class 3 adenylate cyclase